MKCSLNLTLESCLAPNDRVHILTVLTVLGSNVQLILLFLLKLPKINLTVLANADIDRLECYPYSL